MLLFLSCPWVLGGKKKPGNSLRNISGVFQLSFSNRNVFKPNMQKLSSYYLYYLNYITVIVLYVNINVLQLTEYFYLGISL